MIGEALDDWGISMIMVGVKPDDGKVPTSPVLCSAAKDHFHCK